MCPYICNDTCTCTSSIRLTAIIVIVVVGAVCARVFVGMVGAVIVDVESLVVVSRALFRLDAWRLQSKPLTAKTNAVATIH